MFDKNTRALIGLAAENMSEGERLGAVGSLNAAIVKMDEAIGFLTAGVRSTTLDAAVSGILTDLQTEIIAIREIARRGGEREV